MNAVDIKSGSEARELILIGAKKIHDAVGSTLGPGGRNVIIKHNTYDVPQVTKDGVTVARKMKLQNYWHNIGCQLVKQASMRTAIDAGDGTTSSVVMAYTMMKLIDELLEENPEIDVHRLRHEMEKMKDVLIEKLREISTPIVDIRQVFDIAKISTNNDEKLAGLLSEIYGKIGKDGIIVLEQSQLSDITYSIESGFRFDGGWQSHYFVKDKSKMSFESDDCAIFITNHKIQDGKTMLNALSRIYGTGVRDLLIIAENIEGEALSTLIANNQSGKMNICLVNPPYYGQKREEYLTDLSISLGMKPLMVGDQSVTPLSFTEEYFSCGRSVFVDKNATTIRNDKESVSSAVEEHISNLKSLMDSDEEDKEWIEKRIATLRSSVAVIKVGGNSESEVYEHKDRLEDAICAIRSAYKDGIVAGCGITYLRLISALDPSLDTFHILKSGLESVFKKIMDNSCISEEERSSILYFVAEDEGYGYDAKKRAKSYNSIQDGIIDSARVIKNCIENSISVAIMFMISDNIVMEIDESII